MRSYPSTYWMSRGTQCAGMCHCYGLEIVRPFGEEKASKHGVIRHLQSPVAYGYRVDVSDLGSRREPYEDIVMKPIIQSCVKQA